MMNLIRDYELRREIKVWKLNTFIIAFYSSLSLVLHLLLMRTGMLFGYPILSGSLICCILIVIINIVSSYNKANMVLCFILIALFCNISVHGFILLIHSLPSTGIMPDIKVAQIISPRFFSQISRVLISSMIFMLFDFLIFSLLFHRLKINFFISSSIATFVSLSIFAIFWVPLLLISTYQHYALELAFNSYLVCVITLILYSIIGYFATSWIENKYLIN